MKKLFVTLAALCLACVFCVAATYKRGDVNGDGRVDVSDVTTLVDVILGKTTSVPGSTDVDLNGAKKPDVSDVTALVDIILGKHEQDLYLMNLYQAKYMSAVGTNGYPTLNNNDARVCHIVTTVNGSVITIKGANGQPDVTLDGEWDIVPCTDGYNILKADDHSKALMFNIKGIACTVDNIDEYFNADMAIWKLKTPAEYAEHNAKKRFTVATLNVDGMPKSISLMGININLNPDAKEEAGAREIGQMLKTTGWDIITTSENFNYHSTIWNIAWNDGVDGDGVYAYNATTHAGEISVGNANLLNFIPQKPLFKTDGLCLFHRVNTVDHETLMKTETRVAWEKHNGYTDEGADGLITKGFRYQVVKLNDGTEIDLYYTHMDADAGAKDIAAKESQMKQLVQHILATHNGRPIIVMGDTNCRYTREALKRNFIDAINSDARFTIKDPWIEFCRGGKYPKLGTNSLMTEDKGDLDNREGYLGFLKGEVVDKVFYINNTESNIRLVPETYHSDLSFINENGEPLSDHWPVVVEFSYHDYDPAIDDVEEEVEKDENDLSGTYYLRNRETGKYLKAGGWWGTHAVQGEYGSAMEMTLSDGKYTLESPMGCLNSNNGDPYMDMGSATEWTLVQNGAYYSFTYVDNGTTKALTGNDVATFPYGPNTRYVTCANYNAADTWQQWELLTKTELEVEMANASEEKPFNCTHLLPGANFDRNDGDADSYTTTKTEAKSTVSFNIGGLENDGNGNYNFKASTTKKSGIGTCNNTWTFTKTISSIPNGKYKVTFQGFYNEANGGGTNKGAYTINDGSTHYLKTVLESGQTSSLIADGESNNNGIYFPTDQISASHYFNKGCYMNETIAEVKDGKLSIKIYKTENTSSNATDTYFDNFQLFYLGPVEAQQ